MFKVVTSVATFRGESSFRTWALRVATNHLLNLEAVGEMEHLHAIAGIHQSHPRYRAPEA